MANRHRRRRYDQGYEPWYLREIGGLPVWAIIVIAAALLSIGAYFAWDALTR
jgi:hypothetical protein